MSNTIKESDPFGTEKEPAKSGGVVTPQQVNEFHSKADTDSSTIAVHHTLGIKHDQSSPGDHKHDGKNSRKILEGVIISGDRSDGTALISVIDALQFLGATDSTVA
jgi:hypothetical protein